MRLLTDPKRLLPLLVGSVAGVLILFSLGQPNPVGDSLIEIAQIIVALGLFFGLINVLVVHLRALRVPAGGRIYSLGLILAAVIAFAVEITPTFASGEVAQLATRLATAVFTYIYQPLATSVLALLTFFALRASWRALYARPREALPIILVALVILIAGGPWAVAIPGLQAGLDWIRAYPVRGVARGLLLGVGLGAMVTTIRVLLGIDQPYLDR
jgi:hypothetical protein